MPPLAKQYGIKQAASADEVAQNCDVLSLNMNLTAENKQWMNAARIAKMRDGAYVINCARAGLVNEKDIAEALKAKKLGGYGADVFDPERSPRTTLCWPPTSPPSGSPLPRTSQPDVRECRSPGEHVLGEPQPRAAGREAHRPGEPRCAAAEVANRVPRPRCLRACRVPCGVP